MTGGVEAAPETAALESGHESRSEATTSGTRVAPRRSAAPAVDPGKPGHRGNLADAPDEALLRRVAQRDKEAAAELFDRYADEIYGFLLRRAEAGESEDLLQEVFVRALRGASRFRGEASVRTWLYSIARHTLFERRRLNVESGSCGSLSDSAPGPESLVIGNEERRHLVAALDRLPDDQAIVLELHRIDGLSHTEIADRLGIEVATSRKRLERAAKGLERALRLGPALERRHSRVESWRDSLLRRVLPEELNHDERA